MFIELIISVVINILLLIYLYYLLKGTNIINKYIVENYYKKFKEVDDKLNLINTNIINLEQENINKFTYLFNEFSNYSKEKDKFLLEQISAVVNPEEYKLKKEKKETNKNNISNFNINYVLDRINKVGIDNLTKEEKNFLNNYNKNNNGKNKNKRN